MKIQFEKIESENDSSFRWLINPKLNDFFFWHFHPEIELVLIEAEEGTRHVGEHISKFYQSDLVLIGSNIPHLNFDYGIKSAYQKLVLHINPTFFENSITEFKSIQILLEKAAFGITFGQETKNKIATYFKTIPDLDYFEQFLSILKLLNTLATSTDFELLHSEIPKNQLNKKEKERLKQLYGFIDINFQRKIEIDEVAALSNLSKPAFCRYFKKMTKLTFTEFLNHYRINEAKRLLVLDKNITETCYECGFESLSYFNRIFKKITGENPMSFKKRY